jgi:hypothetical protein
VLVCGDDEDETTSFESGSFFPFSIFRDVPDRELHQLMGNLLENEYNAMVVDYCDPLIRREIRLVVYSTSSAESLRTVVSSMGV